MLKRYDLRAFARDQRGNVTLEFIVVLLPLMAIVMAVLEVAVASYMILSSQKAAQMGARMIASRDPVYIGSDMPTENDVDIRYGQFGDACFQADGLDACKDPGGPFVCTWNTDISSGECSADNFSTLIEEMRRVYPALDPEKVVVSYAYERLGYAGGPFVPHITVTILPHRSPFGIVLSGWDLIGSSESNDESGSVMLRGVAASSFGEDLSSVN